DTPKASVSERRMWPGCSEPNEKDSNQGRTDNSWGARGIGDHGAPVSLPKLKKSL
ncbi:unnamed protein product, partial [Staurois parvus]